MINCQSRKKMYGKYLFAIPLIIVLNDMLVYVLRLVHL